MMSVRSLIQLVGDPIRAEVVLLQHYAAKQKLRHAWDRRTAAMYFVAKWAPIFRRHVPPAVDSAA